MVDECTNYNFLCLLSKERSGGCIRDLCKGVTQPSGLHWTCVQESYTTPSRPVIWIGPRQHWM